MTGRNEHVVGSAADASTAATISGAQARRQPRHRGAPLRATPANVPNLLRALRSPAVCGMHVALDSFTHSLLVAPFTGLSPTWREFEDEDYTRLHEHLQARAGFDAVPREVIRDVVALVAVEFGFDSAQDRLNRLKWDGVRRVETFLHRYFGAEETEYTRAVSRYVWTGLAGRVLVPGIKADMVPIIVGPQGAMKSSTLAAMALEPEQFGELDLSRRDEDTARLMQGKVILELPELKGLRARDVESTKAFISALRDEWVPKYRERARKAPRRGLFFGSTNEREFLADVTGARRFLPVMAGKCDPDAMARDREQLWAEGAAMFRAAGDRVDFADAERLARDQHVNYEAADPWEAAIEAYVNRPPTVLPQGGEAMPTLDDEPPQKPCEPLKWVTMRMVTLNALQLKASQTTRATEQRIAPILRKLGWGRAQRKIDGKTVHGWRRVE